ncbi:hypothetical protein GcM3_158017 [Golovinomyces cichoracearum]|uniref:Uncharacterized protein n=1 Tax=Golovinomyces cichoracearum TaxID=62708 RepID=A0A420HV16_9PEZI|nr:hypothetical protein GcM3_158017 [Golovinomyces cichoracearum]
MPFGPKQRPKSGGANVGFFTDEEFPMSNLNGGYSKVTVNGIIISGRLVAQPHLSWVSVQKS